MMNKRKLKQVLNCQGGILTTLHHRANSLQVNEGKLADRVEDHEARLAALEAEIAGDSLRQPSPLRPVPTMTGNGTSMPPNHPAGVSADHEPPRDNRKGLLNMLRRLVGVPDVLPDGPDNHKEPTCDHSKDNWYYCLRCGTSKGITVTQDGLLHSEDSAETGPAHVPADHEARLQVLEEACKPDGIFVEELAKVWNEVLELQSRLDRGIKDSGIRNQFHNVNETLLGIEEYIYPSDIHGNPSLISRVESIEQSISGLQHAACETANEITGLAALIAALGERVVELADRLRAVETAREVLLHPPTGTTTNNWKPPEEFSLKAKVDAMQDDSPSDHSNDDWYICVRCGKSKGITFTSEGKILLDDKPNAVGGNISYQYGDPEPERANLFCDECGARIDGKAVCYHNECVTEMVTREADNA